MTSLQSEIRMGMPGHHVRRRISEASVETL
jgi:hypothetical protein